ncbi:MAG: acetyl-CoA acetyltransferase [Planctomycetota bacterium]|nr:MAG: acetyl-CoA acetyltransferase [Planctomycetota bacterium]
MSEHDLVILGGARTPMAEYNGTPGYGKLAGFSALDLGAHAAKAAMERTGVPVELVDHTVFGNVLYSSPDALYGARNIQLKAGIPIEKPALTVNRLCGSGIQSVISAAHLIKCDEAKTVLAGGTESMSQSPHILWNARAGYRFGQEWKLEDQLMSSLRDPICGLFMAQTAEKLGKRYEISREAQDEYALRSHQLGAEAVKNGTFADEIAPVEIVKREKVVGVVDTDDHIKPDTTLEGLGKLRAAFGKDGTVTAGNASGIVDGAAAIMLTTAGAAEINGWKPKARIVSWDTVGVDPSEMGIGPAPAIRNALAKAGMSIDDIDLFEINEAFSAQYLAVERELELDRDKCNVNGGAIALGHPLGATGTRLLLTLAHSLEKRDGQFGVASACIGGGQGIAMIIERL